jgi:DNA-binding NarL/FixJ family response regulator
MSVRPTTTRGRILIVEDDQGVRDALHRLLVETDFDVVGEAENGSIGVAKAIELSPDVVLMDMRMPVTNGLQAAKQIQRYAPGVQVVILTTHDDPMLKQEAATAGVYAWLVKGCSSKLIETVAETATAVRRSMQDAN